MSKASKKEELGYNPKPIQKMCSNCEHFRSEFIKNEWGYMQEKNIHCAIGRFAVKKSANCKIHKLKQDNHPQPASNGIAD